MAITPKNYKMVKYTEDILKTWRTQRLGNLYVNVCLDRIHQELAEPVADLNLIARIMKSRPFKERAEVLEIIIGVCERPDSSNLERMKACNIMMDYLNQVILPERLVYRGRSFFY